MTLRQKIARDALASRREMVRNGELLREDEFRKLLGLSASRLRVMVAKGSLFTIEVDRVAYFPSLLATSGIDRRKLYSVCRILVPAPPACRLGYLSSRRANLGGISPVVALQDEQSYRLLRQMARAYAAGWWRTSVAIYAGCYSEEPSHVEPVVTAVDEVDPRVNLWKRAAGAIQSGGYIHPPGPYANLDSASVFVALHPAGQAVATVEARVDVRVSGGMASAFVVCRDTPGYELDAIPIDDTGSIVDVVLRIVTAARAHG
ncbi:hypothetical protein R69608_07020 [Paraburkholderia nemoris]|nr:hypothetical protein R69608_07020 [Paraburkholderia nemoris]